MRIATLVLGLLFVVATLLSTLRNERWWIRIWDFPRVQLAALGLAVLVGHVVFSGFENPLVSVLFLGTVAACVAYQIRAILDYTPFVRKQSLGARTGRQGATLRLFVSNVKMSNRKTDMFMNVVRRADPDLILAVETNRYWEEGLRDLERTHPHVVKKPLENTYGMLLYSRYELVEPSVEYLVQDDIPSMHMRVKLPSGDVVEFHSIHPRPPAPAEAKESTPRDVELIAVGKAVRESPLPVIVAGDLNDVAWSRTTRLFQKLSGLLDPRVGRGTYSTFHAKAPFLRFPLDHIFHSNHFRVVRIERMPGVGSDHFPMLVELSYEPEVARLQPSVPVDAEAHAVAAEKERALET